ncbi:hypothetical protein SAMN05518865_110173 [Duganella sp. CF458]|uniref:head-tail joining protein n=1 Tax=Duganella sp. CF458 TaxID=1884368 RepID=UPI0008F0C685|nr:hypothetical protein [Duganella sp. CF458]SFG29711.1 hypothetical protein SAMN05518865_110173 [Duganella sp. CF458]
MFAENMSVFFNIEEHADEATRLMPDGSVQKAAVIFDRPDALFVGDMVQAANVEILYPVGSLDGLDHGDKLTINALNWKVTSLPERTEDGRMMKAQLKEVNA